MKKPLLDLKGKEEIEIPKMTIKNAEFSFDFKDKKLDSNLGDKDIKMSSYFISRDLANAVNAAIITGRPLLLKGEPGCGKTKLAKAVAAYFHEEELSKFYFEWHVKSRSNSKEGAYTFDHVSRLRDATITDTDREGKIKAKNPINYLSLGAMGLSFVACPPDNKFPILLIDEIDKGDIDFPNDLLLELDEMRFAINELDHENKYIAADESKKPLVIITSNDERELPPAFLRRCLYYKIPAFEANLLEKIANSKLKSFYEDYEIKDQVVKLTEEEVIDIVRTFMSIKRRTTSSKIPSTSELLDWLKMVLHQLNTKKIPLEDIIKDTKLQTLALKLMN